MINLFKKKELLKITKEELYTLTDDCLISLKDDKYTVGVSLLTSSYNGVFRIDIKKGVFKFKEIKHDVLQLCNMLSDYKVDIRFEMIYRYQWEYVNKKMTTKDILKGLYDKVSATRLSIIIVVIQDQHPHHQ